MAMMRSTMPTPAAWSRPMRLMMTVMSRKDSSVSRLCSPRGTPTRSSWEAVPRSGRGGWAEQGNWGRRSEVRASTKDSPWAAVVAMAAPVTPMSKPPTRTRSPTMLVTQDAST